MGDFDDVQPINNQPKKLPDFLSEDARRTDFKLYSKRYGNNQACSVISQGSKNVILKEDGKRPGKELSRQERLQKMLRDAQMQEMTNKRHTRNKNYDQLKQKINKQKKREQTINWRDREMFVDKNRAMAVVLGEKDNKDVLEKRKRSEKRERMKLNREIDDEVELGWKVYFHKAEHAERRKDIPVAMEEIRNALSALKRDRINGSVTYNEEDRMLCLKLRAKIFLQGNEPTLALEDAQDVFEEEPDDFGAHCIMAECLYMKGFLERSLSVWHKATKLRPNIEEVQVSIDKVRNTLLVATTNCFRAQDTSSIIEALLAEYGSVETYLESLDGQTEVLTDPNQDLTEKEKRTRKLQPIKVLSSKERKDEKSLLGTSYYDKEFLKKVYSSCSDKEYLRDISEEGFLFLVGRSEFWRQQRPLYVKQGAKNNSRCSYSPEETESLTSQEYRSTDSPVEDIDH